MKWTDAMVLMSALTYGTNATTSTGSVNIIKTVTIAHFIRTMHTENVMFVLVQLLRTVTLVHGIHATGTISSVTIIKQGAIVQYILITEESLKNQMEDLLTSKIHAECRFNYLLLFLILYIVLTIIIT